MLKTEKECIEYIHSAGRFGKKAGLCNIRALLNSLGNPHRDLKCIHVAGTNGKGSVSCMIANILMAEGYKVGMNTSPYIEEFNERLSINGVNIPGDKLVRYTNLAAEAIEKNNIHPIEFEIITAMGFLYFKEEGCDYAVVECGIGGLLDSTNVIENPALCVITRLGLDHTEILGPTLQDIALQKAGIIKENSKAVLHPDIKGESLRITQEYARSKNARIYTTKEDYSVRRANLEFTELSVGDISFKLKLHGSYQASNAALAVNAARILDAGDSAIISGMEKARWKCRFEPVKDRVIIDGAHNPCGIEAFAKSVDMYIPSKNRVFVVGMLNDKDFASSAGTLAALGGRFIITDVPSVRQTNPLEVRDRIRSFIPEAMYEPDYKKAMDKALSLAGSDGYVCVAGSLYLAGAIRSYIMS